MSQDDKDTLEDKSNPGNKLFDDGFAKKDSPYIMIKDGNEVIVEISKELKDKNKAEGDDNPGYLVVRYASTLSTDTSEESHEGPDDGYAIHDWKFDENAYMGYSVEDIRFSLASEESKDPESGEEGSEEGEVNDDKKVYPDNVIHMTLTLKSLKYGEYTSHYFFKASKIK